jgi:rubredoxin
MRRQYQCLRCQHIWTAKKQPERIKKGGLDLIDLHSPKKCPECGSVYMHCISIDGKPLNYEIPSGCIWNFKYSKIPSGWHLCDGQNGTPNMTASFAGKPYSPQPDDTVFAMKA